LAKNFKALAGTPWPGAQCPYLGLKFHRHFIMMARMHSPEAALQRLNISLPEPAKPVASYIPTRRVGNLLYVSGQIPFRHGQLIATGAVPRDVGMELARDCARQCVLNGLAAARAAVGSLDAVAGVVRVGVWVASEPGFTDQPKVGNGASDLLVEIFGDAGRHARAAVGSIALPLGAPVEVELLLELR
jgi:enamine deaminase RidA (YjgF/YER057c/UK114 family)